MSIPKSKRGKTQGVPSTSESRGDMSPVHPWIYAHDNKLSAIRIFTNRSRRVDAHRTHEEPTVDVL